MSQFTNHKLTVEHHVDIFSASKENRATINSEETLGQEMLYNEVITDVLTNSSLPPSAKKIKNCLKKLERIAFVNPVSTYYLEDIIANSGMLNALILKTNQLI